MTSALDTGRTAEAMRAEIIAALNAAFRGFSFPGGRWSTGYRAEMAADALLDGPIAQIQEDLTAARKERDEVRYLVDRLKGEVAAYATEAQLNLEDAAIKETWLEAAREEAAQLRSRLLQAEKGAEAMRKALKPFAKAGELFGARESDSYDQAVYMPAAGPEYGISGDDLRRARAALNPNQEAGDA